MQRGLTIYGYVDKGYDGHSTKVECNIRSGFPGFDLTGLPGASVKEARERVRCALRSCNFKFPQSRVLVNLSPASQPKDSTLLDLPLACAILTTQARSQNKGCPEVAGMIKVMIAGELSLSGEVLPSPQSTGALDAARRTGCSFCILPGTEGIQNQDGIQVIRVSTLPEAFSICCDIMMENLCPTEAELKQASRNPIFEDVIGLDAEKDYLAMAASGFHSILLFGPTGVGKSMLSSRIHMLLPSLSEKQKTEVSRIVGNQDIPNGRIRMLGHDCTQMQFLSGSTSKSPGEGALAHMGTLVLDEINKYGPKLLETVKEGYDKGFTQSSRSGELVSYPSRYVMVGNLNACACGGLGEPQSVCTCTAQKIASHWGHVGRQLIERFDVRLPISAQGDILARMNQSRKPDSYYLNRVCISADRQCVRYKYIEDVDFNGQIHYSTEALRVLGREIELFNKLGCGNQMNSRAQIGCVALARTLADYDDSDFVTEEHFSTALLLRKYGLGDYYWRTIL